jgi:hypothetical protein
MGYRLFFSLARGSSSKYAEFVSAELKDSFVKAMNSDRECVRCYTKYSNASGPERKDLAFQVDMVRYKFFQTWATEKMNWTKPKIREAA